MIKVITAVSAALIWTALAVVPRIRRRQGGADAELVRLW